MLNQNPNNNALSTNRMLKALPASAFPPEDGSAIFVANWRGYVGMLCHYRTMAKSAKKSGEIRPQSAFWTDSPALCGERAEVMSCKEISDTR